MGGESDAEKAAGKSSKAALANSKEGIQSLKDIASQFYADPRLSKILGFQDQYLNDPFTINADLRDQLVNEGTNQTAKAADNAFGQYGALSERMGLSRSESGAGGLNNLVRLAGVGGSITSAQNVDKLKRQQDILDLNNVVNQGMGFLSQYFAPRKEVALGQLGTLGGLSNLTSANAQLAQGQSGPLDFLGGAFGSGLGMFTGGLGLGGAGSLFPKLLGK